MNVEAPATRNSRAGLTTYATVCALAVAGLFLTNWPSYHHEIRGGPPVLWYYALAIALMIPIFFAEPTSLTRLVKTRLFWWFAAYVLAGLVWLLASQNFMEDGSKLWRLRLLQFLLFCSVVVLTLHIKRLFVGLGILGCVFIASVLNWVDVMRPYRFVPQGIEGSNPGRGAGLFMNANSAAEIVVMGTVAALPFIPMRLRALVLIAMVVGVAPTLSRGGLLVAAVVLMSAVFLKLISRMQGMIVLVAVLLLLVATNVYYDRLVTAADSPLEKTITRLGWFEGEEEDYSVATRKWAAVYARDLFFDKPLVGHGLGATRREAFGEGPHNMYLMLMAEQGLFGLALYLSLIAVLLIDGRRLSRFGLTREQQDVGKAMIVYGMIVLVDGFFSHNVLETAYGMFAMAFLATAGLQSVRLGAVLAQPAQTTPARLRWRSSIPSARANDGR